MKWIGEIPLFVSNALRETPTRGSADIWDTYLAQSQIAELLEKELENDSLVIAGRKTAKQYYDKIGPRES